MLRKYQFLSNSHVFRLFFCIKGGIFSHVKEEKI